MLKKLSVISGLIFGVTISLAVGTASAAENKVVQDGFHEGETPTEVFTADNGVVVEVYDVPTLPKGLVTNKAVSAKASTSGWDLVGTEYWVMDGRLTKQVDSVWYSTGGDYMFRMPAHTATSHQGKTATCLVDLYEKDPANADDLVTGWTVKPSSTTKDYVVRSIGEYVDGANKKAEFYTTHISNYTVKGGIIEGVKYYD